MGAELIFAAAPYLIPLLIEAFRKLAGSETDADKQANLLAIAEALEEANDRVQGTELPPVGSGR